ncbi:enoyl-CoA hydratase-related protein [Saccharopolyspora sp. NPDC050642]|uniref:enoyl-CoA hydratase/isomerase family protein n=1 Tax=Saccharopolyspora sp. NPDC050642 TaxID=3157099 RepID=UPI0033D9D72F
MGILDVQQRDNVLHVVFDRPEKLNAMRREDIDAVPALIAGASDIRAIVFRGAGERAFSAGVDVREFLSLTTPDSARDFISALRDMLASVRRAPVTTICAIDGYCIGGALELAVACDVRLVTTRSSFGLPEIKLGIPSVIDAGLLQQYVGLGHAKEMILTGDLYPATAPQLAGLCNRLVEPSGLEEVLETFLAKVTCHTTTVLASQKRLFETWQNTTTDVGIDVSVGEFAGTFAAADTMEALTRYGAELGIERESAGQ